MFSKKRVKHGPYIQNDNEKPIFEDVLDFAQEPLFTSVYSCRTSKIHFRNLGVPGLCIYRVQNSRFYSISVRFIMSLCLFQIQIFYPYHSLG